MTIAIIAALDEQGAIGNAGTLPWPKCAEDMHHFVHLTTGHTVVMGRKTFESIGQPLRDRLNVVLSRGDQFIPGVVVVTDLDTYLFAQQDSEELVWVIGGAEVYAQALPYASQLHLTRVHGTYSADTYFPNVRWYEWRRDRSYPSQPSNPDVPDVDFETWTRIVPAGAPIYHLPAARSDEQLADMVQKNADGLCHFCKLEERQEPVTTGKYWDVFHNNYPYEHTSLHVLIVPKSHHLTLETMLPEEHAEYLQLIAAVAKEFGLRGYSHFMRVGDMPMTGASIAHLHGHIIVGDLNDPDFVKIKVKLAERPDD